MKCPHCIVEIHPEWRVTHLGAQDEQGYWFTGDMICPACDKAVILLLASEGEYNRQPSGEYRVNRIVHPKASSRPVPAEVPRAYAEDFLEACLVLSDSPKASAALSRRCLQAILRDVAQTKAKDLDKQIQEVLDSGKYPAYLTESLDAVRNCGNFAAHPIKSTSSGSIVPVEPGEAEWCLDTLESAFDFFFLQPARQKAKRDALNKKLRDAGKPPMKGNTP